MRLPFCLRLFVSLLNLYLIAIAVQYVIALYVAGTAAAWFLEALAQ